LKYLSLRLNQLFISDLKKLNKNFTLGTQNTRHPLQNQCGLAVLEEKEQQAPRAFSEDLDRTQSFILTQKQMAESKEESSFHLAKSSRRQK
jgi:hypothetical protein